MQVQPIELRVIVQDKENVRAEGRGGGREGRCTQKFDGLRADTIQVLQYFLNNGDLRRRKEFEVMGAHLYRVIFDGEVQNRYEEAREEARRAGQRLVLRLSFEQNAADLVTWPWEYLYRPDEEGIPGYFLATDVSLVLSRTMPGKTAGEDFEPKEEQLRILIAVSSPEGADPPVVADQLIQHIEELSESNLLTVDVLTKPTRKKLLECIKEKRPHVLHFVGYGRFNPPGTDEIALLQDEDEKTVEWWDSRSFAERFNKEEMGEIPKVVVLHLHEATPEAYNANFARLAPELISRDVPAVLAMQYPIADKAAIPFSQTFYRELANGQTIDDAVQRARTQIIRSEAGGAYSNRVFGTPVYYMRRYGGVIKVIDESHEEPTLKREGVRPTVPSLASSG